MGWKIDKVYDNNPAMDGEPENTYKLFVSGNSISDTIGLECQGQSILLEVGLLVRIVKDLESVGYL